MRAEEESQKRTDGEIFQNSELSRPARAISHSFLTSRSLEFGVYWLRRDEAEERREKKAKLTSLLSMIEQNYLSPLALFFVESSLFDLRCLFRPIQAKRIISSLLVPMSPWEERFSIEIQDQSLFNDPLLIDSHDRITRQTGTFCPVQISSNKHGNYFGQKLAWVLLRKSDLS